MEARAEWSSSAIGAAPIHAAGHVIGAGPEGYAVRTDCGVLIARRAVSCLVDPEPGDTVLVSGQSADEGYIIAVLERTVDGPLRMTFRGNTNISVEGGSIAIAAIEGVHLSAGALLNVSSDELTIRARRATVLVECLTAIGKELSATMGRIRAIGNVFESVVERLFMSAKHSLRSVEGVDQVRSGVIDYRADQLMSLRGANVLATARELVKFDGEQIHLG
jgi:hypothetical protein